MKTIRLLLGLVLFATLLLAGCSPQARVGEMRSESQSVELDTAKSVRVEIAFGAGDLQLKGGSEKLMEADFTYNVDKLKPEVEYTDSKLVVKQPEINGFPNLADITDFRNEWGLRLNDKVPMDLSVDAGAGSANLQLAGLSLTRLNVTLGAGAYTVDLSGKWANNLDVTIDAGAASVILRLPKDVGARVKVDEGPHTIQAPGLAKDGDIYTNPAYGVSDVTLQIDLQVGIGTISLEVEDAAATNGFSPVTGEFSQRIQVALGGAGITSLSCDRSEKEILDTRAAYATYS